MDNLLVWNKYICCTVLWNEACILGVSINIGPNTPYDAFSETTDCFYQKHLKDLTS